MSIKNNNDLKAIRSMMERSSKFISLSGWSGILAGIYALIASAIAIRWQLIDMAHSYMLDASNDVKYFVLALITLVMAIVTGILLTVRKSKKNNLQIWTSTTKRLLIHLFVPLVAGGLFSIALYLHSGSYIQIAGTTLVFYGLALINASKFTFDDIAYLGYCEVIIGLIALFFPGDGLFFWAVGFGLLHIIYGILIQRKYH